MVRLLTPAYSAACRMPARRLPAGWRGAVRGMGAFHDQGKALHDGKALPFLVVSAHARGVTSRGRAAVSAAVIPVRRPRAGTAPFRGGLTPGTCAIPATQR